MILVRNGPGGSTTGYTTNNGKNLTTPSNVSKGLLIVQSNITFSGSGGIWDGILLVGGSLTSNGNNTMNGAVVTGLNAAMAGYTVTAADRTILNGNKTINYNSCSVTSATVGMGQLRVFKATWVVDYKDF